jgi:hypothetical protein
MRSQCKQGEDIHETAGTACQHFRQGRPIQILKYRYGPKNQSPPAFMETEKSQSILSTKFSFQNLKKKPKTTHFSGLSPSFFGFQIFKKFKLNQPIFSEPTKPVGFISFQRNLNQWSYLDIANTDAQCTTFHW